MTRPQQPFDRAYFVLAGVNHQNARMAIGLLNRQPNLLLPTDSDRTSESQAAVHSAPPAECPLPSERSEINF